MALNAKRCIRLAAAALAMLFALGTISSMAATEKELYFEERRGKLSYTAVRNGNENWFMSFRDMVPGVTYYDEMKIENYSSKRFYLYMQAVPREQDPILDELLELIDMKVYYNGELFYNGKATGRLYEGKTPDRNLQNVIPLGRYYSKRSGLISVEVGIPGTLTVEENKKYKDKLTKIDWRFMVREVPGGDGGDEDPPGGGGDKPPGDTDNPPGDTENPPIEPFPVPGEENPPELIYVNPKTGDELPVGLLGVVAVVSGLFAVCLGIYIIKTRKQAGE